MSFDLTPFREPVEAALAYAEQTHTFDDVQRLVNEGALQVWPGVHSIAITQVIQSPQARSLHFFLVGGDLDELRAIYPIILQWGREVGCERATLLGRPGWARTFLTREEGWTNPLIYMSKDLTSHG